MDRIVLNVKYNPNDHHRRSIRIPGYDYSSQNMYYVTICVQDRECIFGSIKNNEMILNNIGLIVEEEWNRTTQLRPNVNIDEYVIMPNHIHGILNFVHDYGVVGVTGPVTPTTTFMKNS